MCTPMANLIVGVASTAAKGLSDVIIERKNAKYEAQIAQTNAKMALKEAKQVEQTGIEEARDEKIRGLQASSILYAQNASNGFDANSTTSMYNVQDAYLASKNEADNILDSYNNKAKSYYTQAADYSNKSKSIISSHNSKVVSSALGTSKKVADYWKENNQLKIMDDGVYF